MGIEHGYRVVPTLIMRYMCISRDCDNDTSQVSVTACKITWNSTTLAWPSTPDGNIVAWSNLGTLICVPVSDMHINFHHLTALNCYHKHQEACLDGNITQVTWSDDLRQTICRAGWGWLVMTKTFLTLDQKLPGLARLIAYSEQDDISQHVV